MSRPTSRSRFTPKALFFPPNTEEEGERERRRESDTMTKKDRERANVRENERGKKRRRERGLRERERQRRVHGSCTRVVDAERVSGGWIRLGRSRENFARGAGESVRGEARQLPHVMILPQVSDDVPRHYHPVYRRIAGNREYIYTINDSPTCA